MKTNDARKSCAAILTTVAACAALQACTIVNEAQEPSPDDGAGASGAGSSDGSAGSVAVGGSGTTTSGVGAESSGTTTSGAGGEGNGQTAQGGTGQGGTGQGNAGSGGGVYPIDPMAELQALCGGQPVELFFSEDFAAGNFNQWTWVQRVPDDPDYAQIDIIEDPLAPGSGNGVMRARTWGATSYARPRAEIAVDDEVIHEGDETCHLWRFMSDEDAWSNSHQDMIGQWHTHVPDLSFNIGLLVDPDTYELRFGSGEYCMNVHSGMDVSNDITLGLGVWHTAAWHVKWSKSSSVGYVELYIDGQPLLESGRLYGKTLANDDPPYLKLGTYRYNYQNWEDGEVPSNLASPDSYSCMYYDDVMSVRVTE